MSVYPTDLARAATKLAAKVELLGPVSRGGTVPTDLYHDVLDLHADVEAQLAGAARFEQRQAYLDEIRREIADDRDELRRERDET